MYYAQIKDGEVKNVIVLDDPTLISLFSEGYDAFIDVSDMQQRPGPSWTYENGEFSPPVGVNA